MAPATGDSPIDSVYQFLVLIEKINWIAELRRRTIATSPQQPATGGKHGNNICAEGGGMNGIEFNLHCARVACANYVGYVDHIETALVALSLVGITGPRALSLAVRGLLPRAERQLSGMKTDLSYADTTMRREVENVERLANVVRNLKALADEHNPQPEPTLCELASEIAGMRSAA